LPCLDRVVDGAGLLPLAGPLLPLRLLTDPFGALLGELVAAALLFVVGRFRRPDPVAPIPLRHRRVLGAGPVGLLIGGQLNHLLADVDHGCVDARSGPRSDLSSWGRLERRLRGGRGNELAAVAVGSVEALLGWSGQQLLDGGEVWVVLGERAIASRRYRLPGERRPGRLLVQGGGDASPGVRCGDADLAKPRYRLGTRRVTAGDVDRR